MTPAHYTALIFLGALSLITLGVFGGLLVALRKGGGKARVEHFALPELLMSLVLAGFFIALIVKGVSRPDDAPLKVTIEHVLPNALFFLLFSGAIAGFMRYRGIKLWSALGGDTTSAPRVLATALGLLCALFPVILLGNVAMQILLEKSAQEQELVSLFREVVRDSDRAAIAQILIAGAVIAPLCEEFLFRGFFYGVGKKYLGPITGAVLTSALFAAFHMNAAAFPSLFILALGFTIAYEATGSLLVPIAMHALFNASQLGFLYLITRYAPALPV